MVASVAHYRAKMDFDNLLYEKGGYQIMRAYGRSKLANVLFANELARRLDGSGVTANSLHPGAVATNIWSHAPWFARPLLAFAKLFMISEEQGGDTIVHLASSEDVAGKSGGYYQKNRLVAPSRLASDRAVAKQLWEISAKLVGLAS